MVENGNGRSPSWKWFTGILVSLLILIIMGVTGYVFACLNGKVDRVEYNKDIIRLEQKIDHLIDIHIERDRK